MQNRLWLRYTTLIVDCHSQTQGENAVGMSTINLAFRRLLPKIEKFKKYNKERRIRVIVKRFSIDKWSNGLSWWTDFKRENSKCKVKCKDVYKYNNSNNFTFSICFVNYKREEVEIRHVPSWYGRNKLPYLTSTQLFFFD